MIISGTGSRQLAVADVALKHSVWRWTLDNLAHLKPDRVISGGAEGFDHCLAMAALRLGIPFHLYIPEPGYGDYYWRRNSVTGQDRLAVFYKMVEQAEALFYSCSHPLPKGKQNFIRNQHLVEAADKFLVYDSSSSGTRHCVSLLTENGVPYIEYE